MFDSSYDFINIGKTPGAPFIKQDYDNYTYIRRYKFKTERETYIVEIKCFKPSLYLVEFFLRKDKNNKKRSKYGKLTRNGKASKIISTCFRIMIEHLKKDEFASFAFIGSPTVNDNVEEPITLTQRFRIYRYASINLLGSISFEQAADEGTSCYLILNNK